MAGDLSSSSSRYRILGKLGQGGMGEVYLAEDASLTRKVALKFLSGESRQDDSAKTQLLKEARSAAALDHPYICSIYEVGRLDDREFIAMEYIEGQTLRSLLLQGPLEMDRAIACACEIAEALSHAHEKGIVHRDLKPSNIMLTKAGHIKIMDFGLAKRIPVKPAAGSPDGSTSSTASEEGIVAGTFLYMSPEQVLGKPVDERSDIFSFGIVLYEMLAGIHPFERSNSVETRNAILKENPPPLPMHPEQIPALLPYILKKMLAKDKAQRYQSAHEIHTDLNELNAQSPAAAVGSSSAVGGKRRKLLWLAGICLIVLAAALALYLRYRRGSETEPMRTQELLVDWLSSESDARISPDGKWVTFMSDRNGNLALWRRSAGGGDPEPVAAGGVPVSHAWAPDGDRLLCLVREIKGDLAAPAPATLELIPAFYPGPPQRLFSLDELEGEARADLFNSTAEIMGYIGDHIYLKGRKSIWRFRAGAKAAEQVVNAQDLKMKSVNIRGDEKRIAFESQDEIWVSDLDGGNHRQLTRDQYRDFNPHWIRRDGGWRIIFSSNRSAQLDLVELDPETGRSNSLTVSPNEKRIEDSSADGSTVLYRELQDQADLRCYIPATGESVPLTFGVISDFAPSVSADSGLMAFQRLKTQLVQGSRLIDTEIWLSEIQDLKAANFRKIIEEGSAPLLAPDGKWLAYLVHRERYSYLLELRLRRVSGSQDAAVSSSIMIDELSDVPLDWGPDNVVWAPDGASLIFAEQAAGRATLKKLPLVGNGGPGSAVQLSSMKDPSEAILDPKPDPKMSRIAYCVRKPGQPVVWEIRDWEAASAREEVLFSDSGNFRLYCLGWLGESILALKSFRTGQRGDTSGGMEIIRIERTGAHTLLQRLERGYGQTALFDPARSVLYVTTVDEGIPDITAFYPLSGTVKKITRNKWADTLFTGLQTCGTGGLFYSQQKHISDLYIMKFGR